MIAKKILIAYEHRDEPLVTRIEEKLRSNSFHNIRKDKISTQNQPANNNLEEADLILLAISQNFLNSAYFQSMQMKRAVERHRQRKTSIIFIVLQPVSLPNQVSSWLLILPKDHVPISLQKDLEHTLQEIVSTVRNVLLPLPSTSLPGTHSLTGLHQPLAQPPGTTAPPQAASLTSLVSKLSDCLLSHQLVTIILTIAPCLLLGVFLGLWIGPFVQQLPVLSDAKWSNWLQIAGIVIPILITILGFSVIKSKRLSYEVVSDVGLLNAQKDRGEDDIKLVVNGWSSLYHTEP